MYPVTPHVKSRCSSSLISGAFSMLLALLVLVSAPHHVFAQIASEGAAMLGPRFLLASNSDNPRLLDIGRTPILARRIAINADGATVREALDAISAQAGFRIVYSTDVVLADARVHLKAEGITVAAALTDVLANAGVDVMFGPSGGAALVRRPTHIVLQTGTIAGSVTDSANGQGIAGVTISVENTSFRVVTSDNGRYRVTNVPPGTYTVTARRIGFGRITRSVTVIPDQGITVDFVLISTASPLDRVVTTGTVAATRERELPTPITVVTAAEIRDKGVTNITQLFRGDVPGVVAYDLGQYEESNGNPLYVRGSGSLSVGQNVLKTYVDGIELSDPKLLTSIDPQLIERIEIIRGPEASTVYGSAAMNGVMQIFTKKGAFGQERPQVDALLSIGGVQAQYSKGLTPQHDDAVSVYGGSDDFSYNAGASYRYTGAWLPNYYLRNESLFGSMRRRTGPLTAEVTARFNMRQYSNTLNQWNVQHVMSGAYGYRATFLLVSPTEYSRPQQTLGLNLAYAPSDSWHHSFTVGRDAVVLNTVQSRPRYASVSDTLMSVGESDASRISVAYNNTADIKIAHRVAMALTTGFDHWQYASNSYSTTNAARLLGNLTQTTASLQRLTDHNTGYFAQARVGIADALFITAGLRAEANPNFGKTHGLDYSPRVGAAYVREAGALTVKLRSSYGKSIRPPTFDMKQASVTPSTVYLAADSLGPETQTGGDAGVELYFGHRASVQATYYNQIAANLLNNTQITPYNIVPAIRQWQNLGKVHNAGIETEGSLLVASALTLQANYSIYNTRILNLAPNYSGFYKVGDRLNQVARNSGAATLTYAPHGTTLSVNTSYVGKMLFYDVHNSWTNASSDRIAPNFNAPYVLGVLPANTRVNVSAARDVTLRLNAFVRVDNVMNNLQGDYVSTYALPGRTATFGVRIH